MYSVIYFLFYFVLFWQVGEMMFLNCFPVPEPEPEQRSPRRTQVLTERARRESARCPLLVPAPFRSLSVLSCNPHTHVLHTLNLLIQDSLATDMPSLTRTKQQAGILWVLAPQLLGGEELHAVIHNLFHPPNNTSKTAVFIEKGSIF